MKGVVDCANCGDSASFEGVCPNDIITDTGYTQFSDLSWVCPSCVEPNDITLIEAFEMMLELVTGNMIHSEDAIGENDPILFKEALTQQRAFEMVNDHLGDLRESEAFNKKLKEDMRKGGK